MNKTLLTMIVLAGSGVTVVEAARIQIPMKAPVPFAFSYAGQNYEAGRYEFSSLSSANSLVIRGAGVSAKVVLATECASNAKQAPVLEFRRYGDRYFLSRVWVGDGRGMQIPESKQEKELRAQGRRMEVAWVALERPQPAD